jgi:hypothetical protein
MRTGVVSLIPAAAVNGARARDDEWLTLGLPVQRRNYFVESTRQITDRKRRKVCMERIP